MGTVRKRTEGIAGLAIGLFLLTMSWAADWPMLAHDPQRTGWAAAEDEATFPTRRKWVRSFHEEGLAWRIPVGGPFLCAVERRSVCRSLGRIARPDTWQALGLG